MEIDNGVIKHVQQTANSNDEVEVSFEDVKESYKSRFSESLRESKFVIWWMDIINYFRFKREIKEEKQEPNSKFNKLNLKTNKLGNIVYTQYDFSDNELMWADYNVYDMYMKKFADIWKYFTEDILWGDYVSGDVLNFTTEEGEPTMSYMYMFKYEPILFTWKGLFKWFGIILGMVALIIGIIYGCVFFYNM